MTQEALPPADACARAADLDGAPAPDSFNSADSGVIRAPYAAISRPLAVSSSRVDLCTGFIAQQRLADMLFRRRARRVGAGQIECGGRRFIIQQAVKVTGRANGRSDPYGLTGLVESLSELVRAGASFNGTMMQLGSATYSVVRGVVALAMGSDEPPPSYPDLA